MQIVVVGSGLAGLTAARLLTDTGHRVVVVDKGRRPGGRMATAELSGGARADHGAQFVTVRSDELGLDVGDWTTEGVVHEWCRGFVADDGHPRYVVTGGMAVLPARLARGLDVRQSVHVDAVVPADGAWSVTWPSGHGAPAGSLRADAVVITSPVPQAAALLDGAADVPDVTYDATLSLVVALDGPADVPAPGGVQLVDDPVWSWVGDNRAKGVSDLPSLTLHTTAAVAAERWDADGDQVTRDLVAAAAPWFGGSSVVDARVHRWRYATPKVVRPERCLEVAPGILLAGDAFGGPRVEGAYLSGRAAAAAVGPAG